MAGLLYKDFAAIRGRLYAGGLLLCILLPLVLRLMLPVKEADELLLLVVLCLVAAFHLVLVGRLEVCVVSADEGRKQRQYFLSLPVSRKQYVASKYLFMLLAFLAVLLASVLTESLCLIGCENEMLRKGVSVLVSGGPAVTGIFLLLPAVELPFFIGLGERRGRQIKIGLLMAAFFLGIVYLLFGDLTVFSGKNIAGVWEFLVKHRSARMWLKVLLPCAALLLYYLSFRVSCVLFERRRLRNFENAG